MQNKQVIYSKVPSEYLPVAGEHVTVEAREIKDSLDEGEVLVKTVLIGVDSWLRSRMRNPSIASYSSAFQLDEPLQGSIIGVVEASKNDRLTKGDVVHSGSGRFEQYSRLTAEQAKGLTVCHPSKGVSLTHYLGALDISGFTAYVGYAIACNMRKAGCNTHH